MRISGVWRDILALFRSDSEGVEGCGLVFMAVVTRLVSWFVAVVVEEKGARRKKGRLRNSVFRGSSWLVGRGSNWVIVRGVAWPSRCLEIGD